MWSCTTHAHDRNSLENVLLVMNNKMHMATALEKQRLDKRHTRDME